ncbi:MAG: CpaF family protein [Chloroflexaceae bacterium]|nr:CpaF family protein [Chloroflexaceae bacterium]
MSLLKRIGGATAGGAAVSAQTDEEPRSPVKSGAASRQSKKDDGDATFINLKDRVQSKLIEEMGTAASTDRRKIKEVFASVLDSESIVLSRLERDRLFESIAADILGLGPLEILLAQDDISEIMVNGPKKVFIERKGKLTLSEVTFHDDNHVMHVIERIVAPLGRRVDESSPMVDARLKDGSRVNAIIRPLALCGPTITIRKFKKDTLTIRNLIEYKSVSEEMAQFLEACVVARLNLVVSGGTGSGKTTLLNILSNFIPDDERIITIENAAELQLRGTHVVGLESRPPNVEGKGEITIRDLVINSLRMRPERIIVGECRGGETLDMLQAMNTGHDGSMTTIHANTPKDAVARIETMCLMAGMDLPQRAIREQIVSAVEVFVQAARLKDGSRKVICVTEVEGLEGDVVKLRDVFSFKQTGLDEKGKIQGELRPTGVRPKNFIEKFESLNIFLPPNILEVGDGDQ